MRPGHGLKRRSRRQRAAISTPSGHGQHCLLRGSQLNATQACGGHTGNGRRWRTGKSESKTGQRCTLAGFLPRGGFPWPGRAFAKMRTHRLHLQAGRLTTWLWNQLLPPRSIFFPTRPARWKRTETPWPWGAGRGVDDGPLGEGRHAHQTRPGESACTRALANQPAAPRTCSSRACPLV